MSVDVAALRLTYDAEQARALAPGLLGDLLAASELGLLADVLAETSSDELREAVCSLALDVVALVEHHAHCDFERWITERGALAAGVR